ncbi:kinase-like protein [Gigaspora margarita]|uniref:Kinase-like protein n=1 Tax=Gigaspora margarita TaxID=4874 RepID=A0A8H4ERC3_GIGMA|nr:kinase-like protein [Gigaspora margarita]
MGLKKTFQILEGFRPSIAEKAPHCYVDVMKKCWDKDPNERPSAEKLCEIFKNWQDDEQILENSNDYDMIDSVQFYMNLFFNEEIPKNISTTDELCELLKILNLSIEKLAKRGHTLLIPEII